MSGVVADRVTAWLSDHGPATVTEIARAVRSQDKTVRDLLTSTPLFVFRDEGKRRLWKLASDPWSGRGGLTHKERVLALLSDGKPHSYRAGYKLGVMFHSRVADLRKDGYDIRCERQGDDYIYTLAGLGEVDVVGASTSPNPDAVTPEAVVPGSSPAASQGPSPAGVPPSPQVTPAVETQLELVPPTSPRKGAYA